MFHLNINKLALVTILNNLIFIVYLQDYFIITPYSSQWLSLVIEIVWILSLTFLLILPIMLCSLLQQKRILLYKFPLLAISLSFSSVLYFSLTIL